MSQTKLRLTFKLAFAAVLAVAMCSSLQATSVTYTYTGQLYTTFTGPLPPVPAGVTGISGSITFSAPLPNSFTAQYCPACVPGPNDIAPSDFTFSDGLDTFTINDHPSKIDMFLRTDAAGNIVAWQISLVATCIAADDPNCSEVDLVTGIGIGVSYDETITLGGGGSVFVWGADNLNSPGTWCSSLQPCGGTSTVAPEPGSALLFGASFVGLAVFTRHRWFARS